ncbi:hypothetical protein BH09BAC1_BH09BAC1_17900 [soil metagenome]
MGFKYRFNVAVATLHRDLAEPTYNGKISTR